MFVLSLRLRSAIEKKICTNIALSIGFSGLIDFITTALAIGSHSMYRLELITRLRPLKPTMRLEFFFDAG
jgi:hypothetical protein